MNTLKRIILSIGIMGCFGFGAIAQNSAPAPGTGGIPMGPGPVISAPGSPSGLGNGPAPAPGSGIYNPGTPSPPPPSNWGGPWGPGYGPSQPLILNTPLSTPNWQNSGITTVVACGYDAQGVWRTIPLRVQYTYNGAQYVVNVLAAWNPWTDCWNNDVDLPAFNTQYFINGNTYNFYTNLSTGTFYFNL